MASPVLVYYVLSAQERALAPITRHLRVSWARKEVALHRVPDADAVRLLDRLPGLTSCTRFPGKPTMAMSFTDCAAAEAAKRLLEDGSHGFGAGRLNVEFVARIEVPAGAEESFISTAGASAAVNDGPYVWVASSDPAERAAARRRKRCAGAAAGADGFTAAVPTLVAAPTTTSNVTLDVGVSLFEDEAADAAAVADEIATVHAAAAAAASSDGAQHSPAATEPACAGAAASGSCPAPIRPYLRRARTVSVSCTLPHEAQRRCLTYSAPAAQTRLFAQCRQGGGAAAAAVDAPAAAVGGPTSPAADLHHGTIPGLMLIHEFVTPEEERALLDYCYGRDASACGSTNDGSATSAVGSSGGREWIGTLVRQVQHYGYGFDYVKRRVYPPTTGARATAGLTGGAASTASEDSSATAGSADDLLVYPVEPRSPMHALQQRLALYGFVGNAGNGVLDDVEMPRALEGVGELDALIARLTAASGACAPLVPLSSDAAASAPLATSATGCKPPSAVPSAVHGVARPAASLAALASAAPQYPLPNQITVNEYRSGQGISGHIDTHEGFENGVVSLSLAGDVVMEFVYVASEPRDGSDSACGAAVQAATPASVAGASDVAASVKIAPGVALRTSTDPPLRAYVVLPRRSLLVIRGEARYAWSHAIPARKTDFIDGALVTRPGVRVSITCRMIDVAVHVDGAGAASPAAASGGGAASARPTCPCKWPSVCISQRVAADQLISPHLQKMVQATAGVSTVAAGSATSPASASSPSATGSGSSSSSATTTASTPLGPAPAAADASIAPPAVESTHVHSLYDAIAPHFSSTRYAPWPAVERFLRNQDPTSGASGTPSIDGAGATGVTTTAPDAMVDDGSCAGGAAAPPFRLPRGGLVLDVGCGNGKYMGCNPELVCIGSDRSIGLLQICVDKGYDVGLADAVKLPYRSAVADATLCIAVLHHISTLPRRQALVRELLRVTSPDRGGAVFIQAWALEQGADSRRAFTEQDVFVPWNFQKRFFLSSDAAAPATAAGAAAAAPVDAAAPAPPAAASAKRGGGGASAPKPQATVDPATLATLAAAGGTVDDKKGVVVFQRSCRMFTGGELEALVASVATVLPDAPAALAWRAANPHGGMAATIDRTWWDRDNWCVVVRRWA